MTDPLAALVADLTSRWGDPRVQPPASVVSSRTVLIDGLVWTRLHDAPRRAWAWFPNAANHHLMADRPGGQLVIAMGSPGRRVVLESYDGTPPDEHVIAEAARYAYRLDAPPLVHYHWPPQCGSELAQGETWTGALDWATCPACKTAGKEAG